MWECISGGRWLGFRRAPIVAHHIDRHCKVRIQHPTDGEHKTQHAASLRSLCMAHTLRSRSHSSMALFETRQASSLRLRKVCGKLAGGLLVVGVEQAISA